jgi:hypothetical protein
MLFLSMVKWAGTVSKLEIINSSSALLPIWTIPNSIEDLLIFKNGYFETKDNFMIFEYFCSKIILALETKTFAKFGFIFIWISNFFFLGIIPVDGSNMNPSEFYILNRTFCSDRLSR